MSWLRSSPLRQSLTRNGNISGNNSSGSQFFSSLNSTSMHVLRQRPIDTATDCDPRACYDSFCKHWQQAYDIIQRSELPNRPPSHDDVLGVVSHLDFMVTLILVELHHCNKVQLPSIEATPPAPCLEYMLSENLLDKLYEWGCTTGRYANAVRLEQLKLYELLVSHSRHQLLCHEPFLRPLLKILASSQGEIFPPDLEKRLVILLNQLCVVLMQNVHLLDLFFFTAQSQELKQNGNANENENFKVGTMSNFIIFSLLIPYVHREGSLGHQARDALLLCMALSQKNSNIGTYIAQYSSMCPLLVTGLGGLYSRLPNSIEITSIDWHRITPDDVSEIPELTLFMNALEFCNAVVQVAHEKIKQQLLDFLYQGFIVPVLGPAILQTFKGKHLQTNIDSQISTMSYFDLMLRSITEPSLLRLFVKFLLDTEKFDGERILDSLIERLSSTDANLCMVTMALFDTLLGLHCEDLMLELLLKYLLPGKHVPISYRHKINRIDPYLNTSDFFLDLTPDVMKRARELTKHKNIGDTVAQPNTTSPLSPLPSPTSTMSKTIGANWNYYGLITGESLYSNFHAYLFEAHCRIAQCQKACKKWANNYRYQKWPSKSFKLSSTHFFEMAKQFFVEFNSTPLNALTSCSESENGDKKQLDSLQSLGESSGYESFKWRPADEEIESHDVQNTSGVSATTNTTSDSLINAVAEFEISSASNILNKQLTKKEYWRISSLKNDFLPTDFDLSEDLFAKGTASLGPFINAVWGKLQTFTSNTLYVNLHLTGLITRLAWYPLPLIHSLLLRPDIVITTDTPSFHQVLRILKQQIDAELPVTEDSLEIIDIARSHLIDREFRLINARKSSENSPHHQAKQVTFIQRSNPVQVTPSSSYDPFRRNETERKSLRKSISNIFSRKTNGTLPFTSHNNNTTIPATGISTLQTRETSLITEPSTTTTTTLPTKTTNIDSQTVTTTVNITNERHSPTISSSSHMSTSTNAKVNPINGNTSNATTQNILNINTVMPTTGATVGSSNTNPNINSEPVSLESLSSMGAIANTSGNERTRDLALCAVLLDEWLKELAAISQEQSVVLINYNGSLVSSRSKI